MSKTLSRRRFMQTSLATAAAFSVSSARANSFASETYAEALVIGSGFGGAVASLRLGEAGIETIVLERGRRWPITAAGNTFTTKENPDGRSTWLSNETNLIPPFQNFPIDVFTGLLDRKIAVDSGLFAYSGAGVGGGSLVYGGITIQPSEELFFQSLPRTLDYQVLSQTYYPRVRRMLNATPIPDDILATPAYLSSRLLAEQATKAGLTVTRPDIAIDWNVVREEIAGKKVASVIAGEIYYGTNSGAKNSLDHNYLRLAEETGYVEIKPLHMVTSIGVAARVSRFRQPDRRAGRCRYAKALRMPLSISGGRLAWYPGAVTARASQPHLAQSEWRSRPVLGAKRRLCCRCSKRRRHQYRPGIARSHHDR
jgi:cholesterol oxidase